MNNIYIVYNWSVPDEYTIEDEFLADELKAIQEEKTITAAFVNGEKIKDIKPI